MMQKVVYSGKTECPIGCSNPSELLKIGAIYTVRYSLPSQGVMLYALEEVIGYFYDNWFDDLSQMETRFVVSKHVPEEGKVLECTRFAYDRGHIKHVPGSISFKVHTFELLGKDTYRVIAHGIVFIISVIS